MICYIWSRSQKILYMWKNYQSENKSSLKNLLNLSWVVLQYHSICWENLTILKLMYIFLSVVKLLYIITLKIRSKWVFCNIGQNNVTHYHFPLLLVVITKLIYNQHCCIKLYAELASLVFYGPWSPLCTIWGTGKGLKCMSK